MSNLGDNQTQYSGLSSEQQKAIDNLHAQLPVLMRPGEGKKPWTYDDYRRVLATLGIFGAGMAMPILPGKVFSDPVYSYQFSPPRQVLTQKEFNSLMDVLTNRKGLSKEDREKKLHRTLIKMGVRRHVIKKRGGIYNFTDMLTLAVAFCESFSFGDRHKKNDNDLGFGRMVAERSVGTAIGSVPGVLLTYHLVNKNHTPKVPKPNKLPKMPKIPHFKP